MLGLIVDVLVDIPFEASLAHKNILAGQRQDCHIKIWLLMWLSLASNAKLSRT
jgi:hypothetical protein